MIKELSLHLSYIILIRSQMKERRPKQSKSNNFLIDFFLYSFHILRLLQRCSKLVNQFWNSLKNKSVSEKPCFCKRITVWPGGSRSKSWFIQTLRNPLYFGRYGNVLKIVTKTVPGYKKVLSHQVYATYESELEASLAIAVKYLLSRH